MDTKKKHKKVVDSIITLCNYWKGTNDLASPSHLTLIEEELRLLADDLGLEYNDERIVDMNDILRNLYFEVRKIAK